MISAMLSISFANTKFCSSFLNSCNNKTKSVNDTKPSQRDRPKRQLRRLELSEQYLSDYNDKGFNEAITVNNVRATWTRD